MNESGVKTSSLSRVSYFFTGIKGAPAAVVFLVITVLFAAVSLLLRSWIHGLVLFPLQVLAIRLIMIPVSRTRRLWLTSTTANVFAGTLVTIASGYFYLGSPLFTWIEEPIWVARERKEAIHDLLSTNQTAELENKVGRWGRLLKFPDGSWTAIWYNDTHSFLVASCAVIRDSDGRWLTGEHHFCGTLRYLSHIAERLNAYRAELRNATKPEDRQLLSEMIETQISEQPIAPLAQAETATEARRILIEKFHLREIASPMRR